MPTIDKQGSPFGGRSRSFTVLRGGAGWETCRSCGSVLYPQRRESEKVRTIGGSRLTVEKYRCRCGVGREVRRELAA
jgi:hypothetical protein